MDVELTHFCDCTQSGTQQNKRKFWYSLYCSC